MDSFKVIFNLQVIDQHLLTTFVLVYNFRTGQKTSEITEYSVNGLLDLIGPFHLLCIDGNILRLIKRDTELA
jgi:hypothetical protein